MKKLLFLILIGLTIKLNLFSQQNGKINLAKALYDDIQNVGFEIAINKWDQLKSDTTHYLINVNELICLGNNLLKENKTIESLKIFDICTESFPNSYWAFYQAGRAYMTAGNFETAIELFKKSNVIKDWFVTQRFVYTLKNYTKTVVDIPMRDGIKLKTIIYSPKSTTEKFPFLLVRSPYGIGPYEKNTYRSLPGPMWSFVTEGYNFVFQDVRGKRMSEGEFVEVRPYNPEKKSNKDIDESTDAFDTFEWLLNNIPNNNGKIGMVGGSYHAFYSLMALLSKHPALVAVLSEAVSRS